ncbi:hypothetical protein E2C01_060544 [Portunus trituberculatus]|uniref:Uncharacterized protein n=1 Tax=Portunus trituberculatus TaxID=210409 RepID=A0A5B7HAS1_PORTR|nr:hypothetical protein [Portunus trituberculatus]
MVNLFKTSRCFLVKLYQISEEFCCITCHRVKVERSHNAGLYLGWRLNPFSTMTHFHIHSFYY